MAYVDRWMNGVQPRSRNSMIAKGWMRLLNKSQHGWYRKSETGEAELIIYKTYDGEGSLAWSWGFDLARKGLGRDFVKRVASDHGGLFAEVLLRGFDDFGRPTSPRRYRPDY